MSLLWRNSWLIVGCRLLGISTKYLLNASAITFGFVNVILFSITGEMTEFNDFFKDIRVLIPLHVFFRSLLAWKQFVKNTCLLPMSKVD